METVKINWPSGDVEMLRNIAADAIYTITEGQDITNTQQLPPPAAAAVSTNPAKPEVSNHR
jgi:hypothetical protein